MNKKLLIGGFIVFIMVFSIFGFIIDFAVRPSVTKVEYNDFTFRLVNQQYITKIGGEEFKFFFFPGDLEYITITDEAKALLAKPALTVTYNPESAMAENLGEAQYYVELQLKEKFIERALTKGETALPQRTCDDATEQQPVIELRQSDISEVSVKNSCIVIKAVDPYDLYQQTESVIYTALGVMS